MAQTNSVDPLSKDYKECLWEGPYDEMWCQVLTGLHKILKMPYKVVVWLFSMVACGRISSQTF
jgi:hypothetical protein